MAQKRPYRNAVFNSPIYLWIYTECGTFFINKFVLFEHIYFELKIMFLMVTNYADTQLIIVPRP
jgi:hypothetical protein